MEGLRLSWAMSQAPTRDAAAAEKSAIYVDSMLTRLICNLQSFVYSQAANGIRRRRAGQHVTWFSRQRLSWNVRCEAFMIGFRRPTIVRPAGADFDVRRQEFRRSLGNLIFAGRE